MKYFLIYNILLFSVSSMVGQNIGRAEINGTIVAVGNDVEGVTVYNTSSNTGTVTNQKGAFTIAVTVNDILEVSALQFQMISVKITSDILKSKFLKIYLSEQVNQLDAVLLTSGLSGMLALDVKNTKERPEITIDLGNMNAMEFFEERAFDNQVISDALNSTINKGMLYNGANLAAISKLLFNPKKKKPFSNDVSNNEKTIKLIDLYSSINLSKTYHIPLEQVEAFIVFIEDNGLNSELFKKENELLLIEFLVKQSQLFLSSMHVKN